jgi:hypothetical protein
MPADRKRRALAALIVLGLVGAAVPAALAAQGRNAGAAATEQRRSLLVRGADAVRGLPFFSPNAIAALSGSYALSAAAPARALVGVWYTREPLVLGAAWKRADIGGVSGYALARGSGSALLVRNARYALFFEPPSGTGSDDPALRAFIKAFDRKFLAFFDNAATDAELSFPAYVDY